MLHSLNNLWLTASFKVTILRYQHIREQGISLDNTTSSNSGPLSLYKRHYRMVQIGVFKKKSYYIYPWGTVFNREAKLSSFANNCIHFIFFSSVIAQVCGTRNWLSLDYRLIHYSESCYNWCFSLYNTWLFVLYPISFHNFHS